MPGAARAALGVVGVGEHVRRGATALERGELPLEAALQAFRNLAEYIQTHPEEYEARVISFFNEALLSWDATE